MENRLSLLLIPAFLLICTFSFAQEYGTASYYSDDFDGMETAYGVKYDKNQLTAAHKRHPYGTLLRVTRVDEKKSVTVKVIDKGPWIKGRIVDLSRKAAEELGLIADGVAEVKVEVVNAVAQKTPAKTTPATAPARPAANTASKVAVQNTPKSYDFTAKSPAAKATSAGAKAAAVDANKKVAVKADGNAKVVRQRFTNNGLYKIVLMQPEKKGFGVQVAALGSYENVLKNIANLQAKWFDNILVHSSKDSKGKPMYKVILGPFDSAKSASTYGKSLSQKHGIKGFVIDLAKAK